MSAISFIKYEATGNDLILVDGREVSITKPSALASAMCVRHCGVGADGLLLVEKSPEGRPFMRMFNPDGTEDFCGNGLRCVAAYLHSNGECRGGVIHIESPVGKHKAVVSGGKNGISRVAVEVATPKFAPKDVPVRMSVSRVIELALPVKRDALLVSCVNVGTTHTVIFGSQPVSNAQFNELSPLIEHHTVFPERTSVLWCHMLGRDQIGMRIWERGAGETFGCGTGVCAAAVIGQITGRTGTRAKVISRGGEATAEWPGRGPVKLTGPARLVFSGEWNPS